MSFQQIIARWLAARAMQAVKGEILSAALGKNEPAAEPNGAEEPKRLGCDEVAAAPEADKPVTEIGFVFAMPMEAAGIADKLQQKKTTKADGRIFHTGLWNNRRVALVESGVGQDKAGRAAEILLDVFEPRRVLSAGYGGGLHGRLKQFNVCFPEQLVRHSDGARLDVTEPIPVRMDHVALPVDGKLALLTTDFVVATPNRKRGLLRETGAELVDMETFAVAEVCRLRGVPFLSARIILDTAAEELPRDVQRIMKDAEIGGVRLAGSVLGSLFRRPTAMLDLFSLKQRALSATDRLAKRLAAEIQE